MTLTPLSHRLFLELFKLSALEPCECRMRGLGTELCPVFGRVLVARWLWCPKCKIAYRVVGEQIVDRQSFSPPRKEPPF